MYNDHTFTSIKAEKNTQSVRTMILGLFREKKNGKPKSIQLV